MMKIVGLGLALIFATGCGDLFMGDIPSKSISFNAASCKLDEKAFGKILEEKIESDIYCLQSMIHTFLEFVRTDRPGDISETTLIDFIKDGPIDIGDESMIPIVRGVFDLTHLIFGGERGYVTRGQFDQLIDFLIEFNQNIVPAYRILKEDAEPHWGAYELNRKLVRRHFVRISEGIRNLLDMNRSVVDKLAINQFLDRFFVEDLETSEMIKDFMFVKKIFFGGTSEELTHLELDDALVKLPSLGEIVYDMIKLGSFGFKDAPQKMIDLVYLPTVENIERNLFYDVNSTNELFTPQELAKALNHFEFEDIDFEKYISEINLVKEVFLSNEKENFTNLDISVLLVHLKNILNEGSVAYRIYELHDTEEFLRNTGPITSDLPYFTPRNSQEELTRDHFGEIISKYHFFKGSAKSPLFGFDYDRNFLGVFEIATFEYAVKTIMSVYGQSDKGARGGYHLYWEQTVEIVEQIKRFLRDQKILKVGKALGKEVESVADNVVLMSTLFQFQSDGCDAKGICMEVPELTEFLIGLFTAINFKDFFTKEMQKVCSGSTDYYSTNPDRTIDPECFRREFINVLEVENPEDNYRTISSYMPLLSTYLADLTQDLGSNEPATNSEAYRKFLTETEAFTRTCEYWDIDRTPGQEVFLNGDDAFAVFAGMINIESTMIKFDLDRNNKLDYKNINGTNEVNNAYYSTYENAIVSMVKKDSDLAALLAQFLPLPRAIFQYLVKKGTVPTTLQTVEWMLSSYKSKLADADRTTVATILKVLGEQNAGDNYFKCSECLDDECIPQLCTTEEGSSEPVCRDNPWD